MLNTIYRLIEPRKIEIEFNDIKMNDDQVIVRPTHLSICNADQRYYQGTRAPEVLEKKLPMALIHEGVGVVVRTNHRCNLLGTTQRNHALFRVSAAYYCNVFLRYRHISN